MSTLGPYVIFSDTIPTHWCYFKFDTDRSRTATYHTAPINEACGVIEWTHTPLVDKEPLYVYDPKTKMSFCYLMDGDVLLQVPCQSLANTAFVNKVNKVVFQNNTIQLHLAPTRASKYKITTERYPNPETITTIQAPTLPSSPPQLKPLPLVFSIDDAKAALQVTQCIRIKNKVDCPTDINNGCMYLWKENDQWAFKVNILGIKTGAFDPALDNSVITHLNAQSTAPGDMTPNIEPIRLNLSRPYLNLNPHQQSMLVATIATEWPLTNNLCVEDQIQICRAIVKGVSLASDSAQLDEMNSNIHAFRPYLFPSTINELYRDKALFTTKPAPTIETIILFINLLLISAAQALGDTQSLAINAPPASSRAPCGELKNANKVNRLLYQGLSEHHSELFRLILNAETQGLEEMRIDEMMQLISLLHSIMHPSGQGHALIDVSNDVIAAIAAQQNLTQDAAMRRLETIIENMRNQIEKLIMPRLFSLPREEIRAFKAVATEQFMPFFELLESDGFTGINKQANREAVVNHKNLRTLANTLVTLHKANLLTGNFAQANFNAVVNHKFLNLLADALATLHKANLLSGDFAQANFDAVVSHKLLNSLVDVLVTLHKANLLTGNFEQVNRKAVVNHQDLNALANALATLHKANLLLGDFAQANFDAVVNHKFLNSLANALATLHKANLLSGDFAQANFDAVVNPRDPSAIVYLLRTLHRANLLSGDFAQANFDAVVNHQDHLCLSRLFAILHTANLRTDDFLQANFNALINHPNPDLIADVLVTLHKTNLLSGHFVQANHDAVVNHKFPESLANTLVTLHIANLLTGDVAQANFDTVINHQDQFCLARVLSTVHEANLLTGNFAQANFNAVVNHKDPDLIARALVALHQTSLPIANFTKANHNAVVNHKDPSAIVYALRTLHRAHLLSGDFAQANRDALINHQDPALIADILIALHQANLLSGDFAQANRDAVVNHQDPRIVASNLVTLHKANLLTDDFAQANFNAVVNHQDQFWLARALITLHQANLLSGDFAQANFNVVVNHHDPSAIADDLVKRNNSYTSAEKTETPTPDIDDTAIATCQAICLQYIKHLGETPSEYIYSHTLSNKKKSIINKALEKLNDSSHSTPHDKILAFQAVLNTPHHIKTLSTRHETWLMEATKQVSTLFLINVYRLLMGNTEGDAFIEHVNNIVQDNVNERYNSNKK